ncbi:hypothetical protein EVAR_38540_1 [Eumeta japonica]|uniref:Uncharacterized protein n=1 Tax=Eumeta variegata TaxID=151549 RepID=A0A4C1WEK9_EUMVA|nr:hypothetical protein EVAR_38540_1 [Eumeta japonica]
MLSSRRTRTNAGGNARAGGRRITRDVSDKGQRCSQILPMALSIRNNPGKYGLIRRIAEPRGKSSTNGGQRKQDGIAATINNGCDEIDAARALQL